MIADLDPVIHASATLRFLKDHLVLHDSDLSKQMTALEHAGCVKVSKTGRGKGSSTHLPHHPQGRICLRPAHPRPANTPRDRAQHTRIKLN